MFKKIHLFLKIDPLANVNCFTANHVMHATQFTPQTNLLIFRVFCN